MWFLSPGSHDHHWMLVIPDNHSLSHGNINNVWAGMACLTVGQLDLTKKYFWNILLLAAPDLKVIMQLYLTQELYWQAKTSCCVSGGIDSKRSYTQREIWTSGKDRQNWYKLLYLNYLLAQLLYIKVMSIKPSQCSFRHKVEKLFNLVSAYYFCLPFLLLSKPSLPFFRF